MTELEMFNLIISYFPHRKDDDSLMLRNDGSHGECYGLPFVALGYIIIDFIDKGGSDMKDVTSMINFVNDFYDNKLGLENKTYTSTFKTFTYGGTCGEAFGSIIDDALDNLYPEDKLKPLFKFNKNALQKVNGELQKDDRFNKVLFG